MNQRFMLKREGNTVSWQEMLAIGLAISSILALLSYGMWPNASFSLTIWNVTLWNIAGLVYAFFGPKPKKRALFVACIAYTISVIFLTGVAFAVLGIVLGTFISIYIGKDYYQTRKEKK